MSKESYQWLATNVLSGFTRTRRPWWADAAEREGYATNLFPDAVPYDDVHKLLAGWQPEVRSLVTLNGDPVTLYTADMQPVEAIALDDIAAVTTHKLVRASDQGQHLGVIGIEAAIHTYGDWLTGTVLECVGDDAQVSSAGLLRDRAQAWVQIERPETAVGPDGILFSPYVVLSTSLDGSLASQINQNTQMVVCDNTLEIGRGQGLAVSIKHTSRSGARLGTYRGVMTAIMQGESDFREELERQLATEVSESAFTRFLDAFLPESDDDKPAKRTRSQRQKQDITQLYRSDPRAAAWKGTAFGVVQAVNTYQQHMSQLRNATGYELDDTNLRAMRNYANRLRGNRGSDMGTLKVLEGVL